VGRGERVAANTALPRAPSPGRAFCKHHRLSRRCPAAPGGAWLLSLKLDGLAGDPALRHRAGVNDHAPWVPDPPSGGCAPSSRPAWRESPEGSRRLSKTAVRTVRETRRAHPLPRRMLGSGYAGLRSRLRVRLRITSTKHEVRCPHYGVSLESRAPTFDLRCPNPGPRSQVPKHKIAIVHCVPGGDTS